MEDVKYDAGPTAPCRGCPLRDPSCHAGCPLYASWAKDHARAKAEAYDARRREKWVAESRRWRWRAI